MWSLGEGQCVQVSLSASISSFQLRGSVAFYDMPKSNVADRNKQQSALNRFLTDNTTAVTAVPAPVVPGTVREWDGLNVWNFDSSTATLLVAIVGGGVTTGLVRKKLAPDETLFFTKQNGWGIL